MIKCFFCFGVADLQKHKAYKYCWRYYCAVCGKWLRDSSNFEVVN